MKTNHPAAKLTYKTIGRKFQSFPKIKEPMNALIVWTELGKGLAGTLIEKGAEPDLLIQTIENWCKDKQAVLEVDLSKWAYSVPKENRLSQKELAEILDQMTTDLEKELSEWLVQAQTSEEDRLGLFIEVVRGWFPVGLDIVQTSKQFTSKEDQLGVMLAWCKKYFPKNTSGSKDLGVRVEKKRNSKQITL